MKEVTFGVHRDKLRWSARTWFGNATAAPSPAPCTADPALPSRDAALPETAPRRCRPDLGIGISPDIRKPHRPINLIVPLKRLVRTAEMTGMNPANRDEVALLDAGACRAETLVRPGHGTGQTSRKGRSDAKLCVNARPNSVLQAIAFFHNGTDSISPMLRAAILGLHRDDPLRRVYLRRWWMAPPNLPPPAGKVTRSQHRGPS